MGAAAEEEDRVVIDLGEGEASWVTGHMGGEEARQLVEGAFGEEGEVIDRVGETASEDDRDGWKCAEVLAQGRGRFCDDVGGHERAKNVSAWPRRASLS